MTQNHSGNKYYIVFVLFAVVLFAAPSSQDDEITIVATGDTMLGSWVEQVIADSGYDYPFRHIRKFLGDADVFFTNLEAPFGTGGEPFPKKFNFRVNPDLVKVLNAGKINLVSLANNHVMDYGQSCLQETIASLEEYHIHYAGAGMNVQQARQPAILEVHGVKIGFLAYSLTFPEEFWATDSTAGTCFPYEDYVFKDVAELRKKSDLVIVSCHWGQELRRTPKEYQILFAHQLIDKGADVVLGHHPHVIQGVEFYKGKLVAYSLGNFIFGSYSEKATESLILKVKWNRKMVMKFQILPISVYNKEVEFQPNPLTGAARQAFLMNFKQLTMELNHDSVGISSDGFLRVMKKSL